ncbi:DNA-binding protein S1FA-like isoform X1 [Durio zibethinus]|uniref:DNA-binding protein S1FA-like isoform X1 n=1 Tax=Durio zibethinus TaxID=66656 RepID=A0A6P6AR56_DURZI|nr:DNA-binding protein S1FA-like isoform X1 [Durio zibethinus]
MSDEFEFANQVPPSFDRLGNKIIYETEAKGFNPGLMVLLLIGGLLLIFLVGNYVLYSYAQKTLPPRKKKPISKKKMKRERLKQGVSAPGE